MKDKKRILSFLLAACAILPSVAVLSSCGPDNPPAVEDPKALAARIDSAKQIRAFYDKVNGNYDSLSEEDKAAVNKLTGSEANTRTAFGHFMPNRPTAPGVTPQNGLAPHGPDNTRN